MKGKINFNYFYIRKKISLPNEELRNYSAMYNPLTLREVQDKYPYIQWVDYVNALLPSQLSVTEDEIVVILTPSYFERLEKLLKDTAPRVVTNYLMWRITSYSSTFLTSDLRKRRSEFNSVISGQQKEKERKKECVDITER